MKARKCPGGRWFAALCLVACVVAAPAFAEDAKQVFDSLFAAKIRAAMATSDKADDVALAKELLGVAKTSDDSPQLLALACEAAYDLGSTNAEGYATAVEAMTFLAEKVEAKRAAAREKLIDVLTRQSRTGTPDERDASLEQLVDTLMAIGQEQMAGKRWSEAILTYRRAQSLAVPRRLVQADEVKYLYETAMRRDRAEKQVVRLTTLLEKNPKDVISADQLIRLCVTDLNDPARATTYLALSQDDTLKKLVTLAAKPVDQVPAAQCLELGEWYRQVAGANPQAHDRPLLERVDAYLTRFLTSTAATDLQGKKAQLLQEQVRQLLPKPPEETLISSKATYKVSSIFENRYPPKGTLLADGNDLYNGGFSFHTVPGMPGGHITIDLGKRMTITRIWLENRRDCCQNLADGVTIWISNDPEKRGEKVWTAKAVARDWTVEVPARRARFVTIGLPETNESSFHLAKVKIFGPGN